MARGSIIRLAANLCTVLFDNLYKGTHTMGVPFGRTVAVSYFSIV